MAAAAPRERSLLASMDASLEALEEVRLRLARGEWNGVDAAMDDFLAAFRPVWEGLELVAIEQMSADEAERLARLDVLHRKAMRLMRDVMHHVSEDIRTVDDARMRLYRTAAMAAGGD